MKGLTRVKSLLNYTRRVSKIYELEVDSYGAGDGLIMVPINRHYVCV